MHGDQQPLRLGILASHPIQYQAPLFRELARRCELTVFFAHRQTAQAQAAAGFGVAFDWDVDLLAGYAHEFLPNVARRPDTGRFFGCDTPDIASRIRAGRFDAFLVMGWHLKTFWQAVAACRRAGIPVMVRGDSQLGTQRSVPKRLVKAVAYPWMLRRFDMLLYVGERNRAYLQHYGARADRLAFAPHCIDTDAFAAAARAVDVAATRASWGLGPSSSALLFAGKLLDRKRPADLVAAAAQLRREDHDVVPVFAGDGPERAALEAAARSQAVPAVFLGFRNQTELPAVYAAADVLVLPSESSETWGLVVNEAMACGTPCVVSDACGCAPDMVDGRHTGRAYATGDTQAMARAIADTLADRRQSGPALQAVSRRHSVPAAADGILLAASRLARPEPTPHTRFRSP